MFVFCIKGVSGSGKSSRVFQLFKFLQKYFGIKEFHFINKEGKKKHVGYLVEDLNLVFIGKVYKTNTVERWQGYDVVTGSFGKSSDFSDFLRDNSSKYSFIIEGAGVTRSNRLRPIFLRNYCGFSGIFMQYYNYQQDQKDEYLKRIVLRSGEEPKKGTMWDKCIDFEREGNVSKQECEEVGGKTFCSYDLYDTEISDFGVKFFKFLGFEDIIEDFLNFVKDFGYIDKNQFSNFNTQPEVVKKEVKVEEKEKVNKAVRVKKVKPVGETIFDITSINRENVHWEDYLYTLTPVENVGGTFFKREDYFAPLGYGGINGSKLRQAIWLVDDYIKSGGKGGLISGASVKSPQLPMSSAVCNHFGMESQHVVGATKPSSCMDRDMVKMATWFGAKFNFLKVGYNPVLQSKVKQLLEANNKGDFYLNYGITVPANEHISKIIEFHQLGANQVQNIPDCIENIIVPAGSGNSAISILFGLSIFRPKALKNVYLLGIGPSKLDFIFRRLNTIKKHTGVNTVNYVKGFDHDVELAPTTDPFNIFYFDIHSIPKYDYQREVKAEFQGIEFHPTYEGKMFDFLKINHPDLLFSNKTLFWIVGSKPRIEDMSFLKSELGEFPSEVVTVYNQWDE